MNRYLKNFLKSILTFIRIDRYVYILKFIELQFFESGIVVRPKIDFKIVQALESDMDFIKSRLPEDWSQRIEYSKENNCEFYVAKGAKIYGFTTVNYDAIEMANGYIVRKLSDNQAYSFLSFVFPEYRGNRVFQKLKLDVCRMLLQRGIKDIFAFIDVANAASIKAQTNAGFEPRKMVYALILQGRPLKTFERKLRK
jgi:hypothetical protein